jgi:hypothetical protein
MPVQRRGFLFQYFDKIVCAVVAVLLIASAVYALQRRASAPHEVDEMLGQAEALRKKMQEAPPPVQTLDYLQAVKARLASGVPAGTVREDLIWPRQPGLHAEYRVGPGKQFVLTFNEPLVKGSVSIEGSEGLLTLVEHPVGSDYRQVKLQSGAQAGTTKVKGLAAGVLQVYPVVVDTEAGKTAYPPIELAVANEQGVVLLQFRENPKLTEEQVKIASYQVWRRDWDDPLGGYAQAGTVDMGTTRGAVMPGRMGAVTPSPEVGPGIGGRRSLQLRQTMPAAEDIYGRGMGLGVGPVPGLPAGMTAGGTAVQVGEGMVGWQDNSVEPSRRYSYKVRAVGTNTYPAEGDFTDSVMAEVHPSIDFKFTSLAQDKVRFEVVKQVGGHVFHKEFYVGVGDEIGTVYQDPMTGAVENLLTGMTLVDHHSTVLRLDKRIYSSRIVYADGEGNLHIRWRDDIKSKPIWDVVAATSGIGLGPAVPGVSGPTGPVRRPGTMR